MLLGVAVLVPLRKTLPPLHGDRGGFAQAGRWLAKNTLPGDPVLDPYAWSYYHAGRLFVEGVPGLPTHTPPVRYIVLEHSANEPPALWLALDRAVARARDGKEVQRFTTRRRGKEAHVIIYEVRRDGP